MNNLLKLEFTRLKRQKSFYVCTIIMVALIFLSMLTANALANASPEIAAEFKASGIESLIGGMGNSSFTLIASIFAVLFVCEDYDQQIVKNIYARGYSRKSVYLSKMVSVFVSTTVMFVIVEALGATGVTEMLFDFLDGSMPIFRYGVASFLASNLINNIPMSVLFSSMLSCDPTNLAAVYATVVGSNLGACLTPIGALAGIMWSSILKKHGLKFGYLDFLKIGITVAAVSLAAALVTLAAILG